MKMEYDPRADAASVEVRGPIEPGDVADLEILDQDLPSGVDVDAAARDDRDDAARARRRDVRGGGRRSRLCA